MIKSVSFKRILNLKSCQLFHPEVLRTDSGWILYAYARWWLFSKEFDCSHRTLSQMFVHLQYPGLPSWAAGGSQRALITQGNLVRDLRQGKGCRPVWHLSWRQTRLWKKELYFLSYVQGQLNLDSVWSRLQCDWWGEKTVLRFIDSKTKLQSVFCSLTKIKTPAFD